jgi:hypothetical protein
LTKAAIDLKNECQANNITVMSFGSYSDIDDARTQIKHIKVIKNTEDITWPLVDEISYE